MKTSMCENCIKYKTIYCPNSDKCLSREDKPFYESKYTILVKSEALEGILKDYKQENQQLKTQISAREEEYKKLEDKLVETENWLRPAILQLMDFAKQDYYWITGQQIDSAKLVPIEFTVMGDRCVKFEKLERGVSDVED